MASKKMATRFAELRDRVGLTQAQLARRANVSRGYLADLEAGHRTNPSVPALRRLARALKVPVATLVEGPGRAARIATLRFNAARVFPPADRTALTLRLMIAADDVRCSRNRYVEAEERQSRARGI